MVVFEHLFPTIGAILSNTLSLAAVPSVLRLQRSGTLGATNPAPYPLLFGNAVAWILYSYATGNYYVFLSNVAGVVASTWYTLAAYACIGVERERLMVMAMDRDGSDADADKPLLLSIVAEAVDGDVDATVRLGQKQLSLTSPASDPSSEETLADGEAAGDSLAATRTNPINPGDGAYVKRPPAGATVDARSATSPTSARFTIPSTASHLKHLDQLSNTVLFSLLGGITLNVLSGLTAFIILPALGSDKGAFLLGCICVVFLLLFISSPLATIVTVVQSRNAISIDPNIAWLSIANGVFWTGYGLIAAQDPFIYGPNFWVATVGLVQVGCILVFGRKPIGNGMCETVECVEVTVVRESRGLHAEEMKVRE